MSLCTCCLFGYGWLVHPNWKCQLRDHVQKYNFVFCYTNLRLRHYECSKRSTVRQQWKRQVYKWNICFRDKHTTAGAFCMITLEHRLLVVKKYLAKQNIMTLEHLPYSQHLSPCEFLPFPWLKSWKDNNLCEWRKSLQAWRQHRQRYQKLVSRYASKSFRNISKACHFAKRTTLKEMLCKLM
jgi:hypothetical protein